MVICALSLVVEGSHSLLVYSIYVQFLQQPPSSTCRTDPRAHLAAMSWS